MKTIAIIKVTLIFFGFYTFHMNRSSDSEMGVVVDKFHTPPYLKQQEYYSITFDAPMSRTVEVSGSFNLVIRNQSGELINCRVSQTIYKSHKIGMPYAEGI